MPADTSATTSDAIEARVRKLLRDLTVEEKASLLAGVDDWHLRGFPRLGIPSIRVTDCGHGVSLCGDKASPATCFPTGIGMAATWNVDLMERVGRVIGRETRALGCSLMLGPKINLHRHPLNGRCFETFSEDPHLAGMLGGAMIRGIQGEGVGACVKAMAANNQQKEQGKVSSEVDERTLRELYLRAFEIAVTQGSPAAIMTSYNRLNGPYTSESPWLLRQVIKTDWNYPGVVLSDWRAVHGPEVYPSGLDLEMPGPGTLYATAKVLLALRDGHLTQADIDEKVARILALILRYGQDENVPPEVAARLDTPDHRATALAVAEESIVLLKNRDDLLPLEIERLTSILVVGPNAGVARLGGGGSASVTPFYSVSPLDGIREICGDRVVVHYQEGCSLVGTMEPIRDGLSLAANGERTSGLRAEFYNGPEPVGEPTTVMTVPAVDFSWGWASPCQGIIKGPFAVRFTGRITPSTTGLHRLGIHVQEGCARMILDGETVIEAWDGETDGNFEARYRTRQLVVERLLTAGVPVEIELTYGKRAARAGIRLEWEIPGAPSPIDRAVDTAREVDAVVVCTGLSNLFEGGAQDRTSIDLPEAQNRLIEALAAANPRTIVVLNNGGPLAMPWEPEVAALLDAWYPGQEGGRALARILFGVTCPSGRLPDTLAHRLEDHAAMRNYPGDGQQVRYEERLAVGYRHFDTAGVEPHFPFGFGLSYTTFVIGAPILALEADGHGTVSTTVRNTGKRSGQEVAQLYVRSLDPIVERPDKELRGFRKIALDAGCEAEATFTLTPRDFAHFDPKRGIWHCAAGRYEILLGANSRSLTGALVQIRETVLPIGG